MSTFQSNPVNSELSHFNVLYAHTLALLRQNASLQSTIAQLKNIKLEIAETIGINKNWLPPLADINSIFRALHKELTLNTFALNTWKKAVNIGKHSAQLITQATSGMHTAINDAQRLMLSILKSITGITGRSGTLQQSALLSVPQTSPQRRPLPLLLSKTLEKAMFLGLSATHSFVLASKSLSQTAKDTLKTWLVVRHFFGKAHKRAFKTIHAPVTAVSSLFGAQRAILPQAPLALGKIAPPHSVLPRPQSVNFHLSPSQHASTQLPVSQTINLNIDHLMQIDSLDISNSQELQNLEDTLREKVIKSVLNAVREASNSINPATATTTYA